MKQILKSSILTLTALAIALNISPMDVKAYGDGIAGYIYETSEGHSFSKDWQATSYGTNSKLIYGYNTTLTNEDYSWAYHYANEHNAIVENDRGAFESSVKAANKPAKIEVMHKGTFVQYQNVWYK